MQVDFILNLHLFSCGLGVCGVGGHVYYLCSKKHVVLALSEAKLFKFDQSYIQRRLSTFIIASMCNMKTCSASYLFGDTNINIVLDLVKCKIV